MHKIGVKTAGWQKPLSYGGPEGLRLQEFNSPNKPPNALLLDATRDFLLQNAALASY